VLHAIYIRFRHVKLPGHRAGLPGKESKIVSYCE
jgi:hypothetical protein